MIDSGTKKKIEIILAGAKDMAITTIREDGLQQATTASYVNDGIKLYFGCDAGSQRARNIVGNGKVALSIIIEYGNRNVLQDLSMGAQAERVTDDDEIGRVGALMHEKFPQVIDRATDEAGRFATFKVTPRIISIRDRSTGVEKTEFIEI